MRADDVALAGGLCLEFGELHELLQEHLDEFDALLPHLLIADVTRWLVARMLKSGPDDPVVNAVLEFFETRFAAGSDHTKELVAVSLLETMPLQGEAGSEIRNLVGTSMRQHVDRYLTW